MKQYCLYHSEFGYLTSNKWFYGSWSDDIVKAKKWNSISHVKSLQKQTSRPDRKECEIVEIEIFGYSVFSKTKLEIIQNKSKYSNL